MYIARYNVQPLATVIIMYTPQKVYSITAIAVKNRKAEFRTLLFLLGSDRLCLSHTPSPPPPVRDRVEKLETLHNERHSSVDVEALPTLSVEHSLATTNTPLRKIKICK